MQARGTRVAAGDVARGGMNLRGARRGCAGDFARFERFRWNPALLPRPYLPGPVPPGVPSQPSHAPRPGSPRQKGAGNANLRASCTRGRVQSSRPKDHARAGAWHRIPGRAGRPPETSLGGALPCQLSHSQVVSGVQPCPCRAVRINWSPETIAAAAPTWCMSTGSRRSAQADRNPRKGDVAKQAPRGGARRRVRARPP